MDIHTSAPTVAIVTTRNNRINRKNQRFGWFFLSPFALVFLIFFVSPLAYAFWLSLNKSTLVGGAHFSGLENYATAFTDGRFLSGLLRVFLFAVVFVPIQIGLALVFALILDDMTTRLSHFARLVIFIPYAVPGVIGALMWGFLYSPGFGPLSAIFGIVGLQAPNLLATNTIFYGLTNVVTWQWTGYYMIILYATLRSIDPSLYEAARIDGANRFQTAVRIKIPMVASSVVLVVVFSMIGTLQFFTEPQIFQKVAANAIDAAYTPNLYAYNLAFSYHQFNYSSTISFATGFLVFGGASIFLFAARKRSGLR